MKALFLIFHGFSESNGISKKIRYQIKALKECGLDVYTCYYEVLPNGHRTWMIDDAVLKDLGTGKAAKIKKRISYKFISQSVAEQKIEFVYMRSYHNANPFTINLVKRMKASGAKVVMEIPTYPYDQEYITPAMKLDLYMDKLFRHKLAQTLHAIITFTNHESIFGQRTIQISNGIDFSSIPMKEQVNDISRELHLIAVAEIHYWHGFDRLIHGLGKYYQETNNDYKVYFHLVGAFSGPREKEEIMSAIHSYSLEPYVILHGAMHGQELDELFEECDFAIGSLARHRSKITHIKTLKNREYAARGIPFIYSEIDEDFESMPYILKAPADESAVDIVRIIQFAQKEWQPSLIRDSIHHLSWTHQMELVLKDI